MLDYHSITDTSPFSTMTNKSRTRGSTCMILGGYMRGTALYGPYDVR